MTMSIDKPNSAQTSHILGVDFGVAKIGLAIADIETKMAFAYETIKNDKDFFDKLKQIIEEENVEAVVMGITTHQKDDQSAELKKEFGKQMQETLKIPIYFQEEMFTTKMAHENIKMQGKKNIAAFDDKEAARIILQEWLDEN